MYKNRVLQDKLWDMICDDGKEVVFSISYQLSAISYQLSAISYQLSAIS